MIGVQQMKSLTLNLTNTKKYLVALYIIISSVTTSVMVNRIALIVTMGLSLVIYLMTFDYKYRKNAFLNCLLLYGFLLILSTYYTSAPTEEYNPTLIAYITMFILVFFIISCIKSEEDVKFFIKVFIITAIVNCVYTYFLVGSEAFSLLRDSDTAFRLASEEQNANSIGMMSAYGAVFSIYFFMYEEEEKKYRLLYAMAFSITFVFSILTGSRKALLMLFVGCIMVIFHKNAQGDNAIRTFFKMIIAFIIVGCIFYWFMVSDFFTIVRSRTEMLISGLSGDAKLDHSASHRLKMIENGWKVFWMAPLLGNGICSSYTYFLTYSHNNYVEILMNNGIVGLIIFYKPIVMNTLTLFRLKREIREPLYIVALFVFLWILIGGYGYVFYSNKIDMSILAIFISWVKTVLNKSQKSGSNNDIRLGDRYGS